MKNLFKSTILGLGVIAMTFNSCSSDDKVVDQVLDGATNGAVLRALNDTADNDPIVLGTGNTYTIEIEEQDVQEGDLMDFVNVYVRFDDRTILSENSVTGEGADLSTAEGTDILLRTIQADEFSTDTPFGLPRTNINITEADLAAVLPTSSFNTGDTVRVRLELVLTDGRVFSIDNAAGVITGFGSFFSSPFQHEIKIDSGINISYLAEDRNSFVTIDGFTNDYFVNAEVTDQAMGDNIATVNVYKRFLDLTTLEGPDNTVTEELMMTFSTADFVDSANGYPSFDVNISEEDLLGSLTEDDLEIGDAFFIRYEVLTVDGRTVTNELEETDFYDKVQVTDCPNPALDETDSFVGGYSMEQVVPSIFGYDTFGTGQSTTLFSEVTGGVDSGVELDNNQRSFDADYLHALGFGNTETYVLRFDLCKVSMVNGSAPISGTTGVWCGNTAGIILGFAEGGGYNALDDNEFTVAILDDVEGECGDPGATVAQVKFTKQ